MKLELLSAIALSNSYAFLMLSKLPACIHLISECNIARYLAYDAVGRVGLNQAILMF